MAGGDVVVVVVESTIDIGDDEWWRNVQKGWFESTTGRWRFRALVICVGSDMGWW